MAIMARDGLVSLDNLTYRYFLGTTGSGVFPPKKQRYSQFSFAPKMGERGVLVFADRPTMDDHANLYFYEYWWVQERVKVGQGQHVTSNRCYSSSADLGLMVMFRDSMYVTREPKQADHTCKVVDLFEMLRYLEGKISLADLDRNARSVARRVNHLRRMRELTQWIDVLTARLDRSAEIYSDLATTEGRLRTAALKLDDVVKSLGWLDFFKRLPQWLVPQSVKHTLFFRDKWLREKDWPIR